MEMERVDLRLQSPEERKKGRQQAQLAFQLNHTMPMTEEYTGLLHQLFQGGLGEGSYVTAPLQGACMDRVKIGDRVFINANCLFMARGSITIEDDVLVAANVSLISNNHDPYERQILTCSPVVIQRGAWIGAGATILPGVTVGRYAIVGASAVVTHDVPDYAVVMGAPAKVTKYLEADRFPAEV